MQNFSCTVLTYENRQLSYYKILPMPIQPDFGQKLPLGRVEKGKRLWKNCWADCQLMCVCVQNSGNNLAVSIVVLPQLSLYLNFAPEI
jgi:hypothetical protein